MTKKQWVEYYRKKYPSRSDKEITRLAEAAFADQQNKTGSQTGVISFDDSEISTKGSGVTIGFGLTDANGDSLTIAPARLPRYMQRLLLTDPKAFQKVQVAVYQASGRKYSDPEDLGLWLQGIAIGLKQNMNEDSTLKNVNVETVVNAAIANRASNPLFARAGQENLPTRQIYAKTKAEVDADINKIAEERLGRSITEEDMAKSWYKDLRKSVRGMYNEGILTTTERVKNPKTGKMEVVVKQVPSFSSEEITKQIGTGLETADPEAAERKKRIDNTKWLYAKGGLTG